MPRRALSPKGYVESGLLVRPLLFFLSLRLNQKAFNREDRKGGAKVAKKGVLLGFLDWRGFPISNLQSKICNSSCSGLVVAKVGCTQFQIADCRFQISWITSHRKVADGPSLRP